MKEERVTASDSDSGSSKALRNRIADFRNDLDLTQFELAEMVGVRETTISYWETGRRDLQWLIRSKKLCEALECTLDDLIGAQGREPTHSELLALYKAGKLGKKLKDPAPADSSNQGDDESIGKNIARYREKLGLTQHELADRVGVKDTTVSYWETGRRNMSWLLKSNKLCKALQCPLDQLVRDEDSEPTYEELLALYNKSELSNQPDADEKKENEGNPQTLKEAGISANSEFEMSGTQDVIDYSKSNNI